MEALCVASCLFVDGDFTAYPIRLRITEICSKRCMEGMVTGWNV